MMAMYPEHDKLTLVSEKSQAIGEFLEWLNEEKGIILAVYEEVDGPERLYPTSITKERLLAEHFGIDLATIEAEKRDMLESLRAEHSLDGDGDEP